MRVLFFIFFFISTLMANENLEKVSLQLKWKYQFQFAGFIAAKEKGFYKNAGLNVTLKEFNPSIDIVDDVQKGKATFGTSDSALIYDALKGNDVLALMAIYQASPLILLGLKNRGIKTLGDLNNKKLALYEGIDGIAIKAMLKANHVRYVIHQPVFHLDKLLSGKVDMITAYISNEPYLAKQKKIKTVIFAPKDFGFEWYGDILFTSKNIEKNNPEMVKKFHDASYKGWVYAFSHIDEIVEIIYQKYNTLKKTKEALKYEAKVLKELSGYPKNFGKLELEKIKGIAGQFNLIKDENNKLDVLDNFIYKYNIVKNKKKSLKNLVDANNNIFTKKELEYLKKHKKHKVCVQAGIYPIDGMEDGKHTGYTGDIYRIIAKELKMKFEFIDAKKNSDLDKNVQANKCDIISIMSKNQKRFPDFVATDPYMSSYMSVITRNDKAFIRNEKKFEGKLLLVKFQSHINYINHLYPKLDVRVESDEDNVMELLEDGEAYGYVEPDIVSNYVVNKYGYKKFKINGFIGKEHLIEGAIGVNKKNPILLGILNKALKNIDKKTFEKIKNNWSLKGYIEKTDYALAWKVFSLALVLLSLFFYRQRTLKKYNLILEKKVKDEVEKNRKQELVLLEKSRHAQMGEMISMIAHQWRQPLNILSMIIQGTVFKYRRGLLNDDLIDNLDKKSKIQIMQMSNTIDDFKNFFKPEKELVEFDLTRVMDSTINMLSPVFNNKKIQLSLNIQKVIQVEGYPNEFGQILINILNNAKDALVQNNSEDNRNIKISLKQDNTEILLHVEDNAGGIPEDIISKVFDPYFSTKLDKNGTGLGLYMSKLIIESHMRGKISVANKNNGAVFTLSFQVKG